MRRAVILAGGLGSRLKPFTEAIPKALLPVGEKAVLEIQIERLSHFGFREIFIATNYKAQYIESFIGNGSRLGVSVFFSKERRPLGTCGPLRLIQSQLALDPFVVMNGDILSNLNFDGMMETVQQDPALLTVVTKKIRTPFNFGRVTVEEHRIIEVTEKPDLEIEVLAGIYYMRPEVFQFIPAGKFFGMDDLIKKMLSCEEAVGRYLMSEYWLDIGRIEDYQVAEDFYNEHLEMDGDDVDDSAIRAAPDGPGRDVR